MRLNLPNLLLVSTTTAAMASRSLGILESTRGGKQDTRKIKEAKEAKAKTFKVGELSIKLHAKSGEVDVSRSKMGKKKDKASTIKISIDSIQEVNSEGVIVGAEQHSIGSLVDTEFKIGVEKYDLPILIEGADLPLKSDDNSTEADTNRDETVDANSTETRRFLDVEEHNSTSKDSNTTEQVDGGAVGATVTISAILRTGSTIETEMILISGGGEVGTSNERWAVQPGDAKFNIALTNWTFCDPCADGTGEFIDVNVEIKGKMPPKHKKEGGVKKGPKDKKEGEDMGGEKDGKVKKGKDRDHEHVWDLGEGATLDLTDSIRIDGTWTTMPEGYPKLVTKGGKQMYTFRFPKFSDNAWYDPVVSFDENYESAAMFRSVTWTSVLSTLMLFVYAFG